MNLVIKNTKTQSGARAAADGARFIRTAISATGQANIVVATGASQFEMLDALVAEKDVPWHKVVVFHLDEYVGLPITHPASFRLYLWQRFHSRLPQPVKAFHYLDGEGDAQATCQRIGRILSEHPIDVAFIGIGENGHIAFNDPPADFQTDDPYIVVDLDEACRQQQLGEGWFPSFEAVPKQAISMSVKQIIKSKAIVCTVPDERKARALKNAVEGRVTPDVPASILQTHPQATIYMDVPAASLLKKK